MTESMCEYELENNIHVIYVGMCVFFCLCRCNPTDIKYTEDEIQQLHQTHDILKYLKEY